VIYLHIYLKTVAFYQIHIYKIEIAKPYWRFLSGFDLEIDLKMLAATKKNGQQQEEKIHTGRVLAFITFWFSCRTQRAPRLGSGF